MSRSLRAYLAIMLITVSTVHHPSNSAQSTKAEGNVTVHYHRETQPSVSEALLIRIDHVAYGKDGTIECGITLKNGSDQTLYVMDDSLYVSVAKSIRFWRIDSPEVYLIKPTPGWRKDYTLKTFEIGPNKEVTRFYMFDTRERQRNRPAMPEFRIAVCPRQRFDASESIVDRLPEGKYGVTCAAKIQSSTTDGQWGGPIREFHSDSINIHWCSVTE